MHIQFKLWSQKFSPASTVYTENISIIICCMFSGQTVTILLPVSKEVGGEDNLFEPFTSGASTRSPLTGFQGSSRMISSLGPQELFF
jgi:hypothetical protein